MPEHRGSLLHPVYGAAAGDIRRAVDASPAARLTALERSLDATRRALTFDLKLFRGFRVQGRQTFVTPDSSGWIHLYAPDGNPTVVEVDPNVARHAIKVRTIVPETEGCDCCGEDMTFNFIQHGGCPCLAINYIGTINCVPTFQYALDCGCIRTHAGLPA